MRKGVAVTGVQKGRGPEAVADMKARLESGWSVFDLWDRFADAENGAELVYDMADRDSVTANT